MKPIFLLSIVMLAFQIGLAQKNNIIWAPVGAAWEYQVSGVSGPLGRCNIKVLKDTIIDKVSAKILVSNCFDQDLRYYLNIGNQTVNYHLKDSFYKLYDFNVLKGDAFNIGVKRDSKDMVSVYQVKKVSDTILNLKEVGFKSYSLSYNIRDGFVIYSPIIELMGSMGYLFPLAAVEEFAFTLTKYTDTCWDIEPLRVIKNGIISFDFKVNRFCFTSPIHELDVDDLGLSIYPNPIHNKLYIQSKDDRHFIRSITIVDIMGKAISKRKYINAKNIEYDTSVLPTGFYFLKMEVDGRVYSKKILKE